MVFSFKKSPAPERERRRDDKYVDLKQRQEQVKRSNGAARDDTSESYLKASFCTRPFDTIETTPEGFVHVCCPGWLPTPIGEIEDGLPEIWQGETARKMRRSIVDGSFRYCSHLDCPLISGRTLMRRDDPTAQRLIESFTADPADVPAPTDAILSHDRSCNLSCPSCRTDLLALGKSDQSKLDDLVEAKLMPILKQVKRVYVTGSGDPFGSAHFRRLLKQLNRDDFPDLEILLHTNGQLWDERGWKALGLEGRVASAHVSIDAAEPHTYSIVRRGGTFERLRKNLAYVKTLREAEEIKFLCFSMVVQDVNYRQMPDFVDLGQEFGADEVSFQMIRNWGTYDEAEFKRIHIGRSHPDFADLAALVESPKLNQPGVDIGNIKNHIRLAMA